MIVACECEGLLEPPTGAPVVRCTRCGKEYPFKELRTILMLLKKAFYTPSSEQQSAPNEHEQRAAINLAARRLCKLKLRILEDEPEPARQPVAPRPTVYAQPAYTTTTWVGNIGNVYVRVNFWGGGVS